MESDVHRLVITDLKQGTYFAQLELKGLAGEKRSLDCRPSDGIALALRAGAAMYVVEKVMSQTKNLDPQKDIEDSGKLREWLASMDPDDFGKYKM